MVISRYVNRHRNSYLSEALHQLISKNAVEQVQNPKSLGFFQQTFPSAKTQQQMETHSRPKQTKPFSQGGEIQDGNTGNHQNFPSTRGMGHLKRLQRRLLPHTNTGTIQKISEISRPGSDIPIQGSALWSIHSTFGVHSGSQGSQANGHTRGYKDPPVPRRLVGESQVPPSLSPAYQGPAEIMPRPGLDCQLRKIRAGTETSLRLCRLPVRPQSWSGPTHTRTVAESQSQDSSYASPAFLSGPTVHVLDRSPNGHRKASLSRPTTHEAYTVAPEKQLESTGITRKGDSNTHFSAPPSRMVVRRRQRATRPTVTSTKTCSADLYRRIKRRVGRSLKRAHSQRRLVSTRKQTTHKLPRVEGSPSSSKPFSTTRSKPNSPCSYRQHHSSVLHKQGRRHEVRPTLCSTVENFDMVYGKPSYPQSPAHSRPAECGSGQTFKTKPDYSNRMVSPHRGFSDHMHQVAPTSNRPLCHEVQQQTPSVCLTSARLPGHCSRCTQPAMGGSGCLSLPTSSHLGQSSAEATRLPRQQDDPDCSRLAQHALVLGPSGHVQPNPIESAQPTKPSDTALQPGPSQKPVRAKSPCMAPRASAIKEQGFSEAVATRIEAPQRGSTRSVYEAKWAIFTKWCLTNKVDFGAPPVTSIADFLLYLFQDRKLQPSTIDGYRSAIADKLGNSSLNISKDENLISWTVSTETGLKVGGAFLLGTSPWFYTN